jgi:uncharacterized protein YgiM (DUF1202 family)
MGANPGRPSAPPHATIRRVRRRRWRRALGVLAFAIAAVAIGTLAFKELAGPGSGGDAAAPEATSTTLVSTLPPAGPYKVTDGLNVRTGPGRTFPTVGTIELGKEVMVACVIEGETVDGPNGPTTKWLRVTAANVTGYVTSQYVATGAAVNDPAVIPRCSGV